MARTRRLSVDQHSKTNGSSARGWSHDEVKIARMKPVCDSPAGSVQHGSLCLQRPFTGKRPLIETQARRNGIAVTAVCRGTARRRELLSSLMADVCFRRLQAVPVRGHLGTTHLEGNGRTIDPFAATGGCQQLSKSHFRFFVVAFAEVVMAHVPRRIDEIKRWPVVVAEAMPDRAVVVDGNRIREASLLCGPSDVVDVCLEREFGGMDTDDDQPLLLVPDRPTRERMARCEAN